MGRRTLRLRPSKPRLLLGAKPSEPTPPPSVSSGPSGASREPEPLPGQAPLAPAPGDGQTIRSVPYRHELRDRSGKLSNAATRAAVDGIASSATDLSGMTAMGVCEGPADESIKPALIKSPALEPVSVSSTNVRTPELKDGASAEDVVLGAQPTQTPTSKTERPSSMSPPRSLRRSRRASPRLRQRYSQDKLKRGLAEASKPGLSTAKTTGPIPWPSSFLHPLRMNPPDGTARPVLVPRMTSSSTMPLTMAVGKERGRIQPSSTSADLDSPYDPEANRRPIGLRGLRSSRTMVFPPTRAPSGLARLMKENIRRVSTVLGLRRTVSRASPTQFPPANMDTRVEQDVTAPASQPQRVDSAELAGSTNTDTKTSAKSMVQQMFGKRLMRRNVQESWKDTPTYPSAICEDPFSEYHPSGLALERPPRTVFEARLRASSASDDGPSLVSLPSTNPFESEGVFDTSLNAMLPCEPLGSSTPRPPTQLSDASLPDSPTKRPHGHPHSAKSPGHARSRSEVGPLTKLVFAPVVRRKKHPSPAKYELEMLEKQLQILREVAADVCSEMHEGDSKIEQMPEEEGSPEDPAKVADMQPSQASHKKSNSLSHLPRNRNSGSSIVGVSGLCRSSTVSAIDFSSCAPSRPMDQSPLGAPVVF